MKWNNIMPLEFAEKSKRMRAFGTLNGRYFFVARISQELQIQYYYDVAVEITSFSGVHPLCQINRIKEVTPYSPSTPVRQPSRSSSPSNKRFLPNQILLFRLPLRKKKEKNKNKTKDKRQKDKIHKKS